MWVTPTPDGERAARDGLEDTKVVPVDVIVAWPPSGENGLAAVQRR